MHLRFTRYPLYKLHFSRVLLLLREWGKNTDGYRKCDLQTKWYRARFSTLETMRMGDLGKSMWDLLSCPETKPRIPALGVQSVSPWSNREVPYL